MIDIWLFESKAWRVMKERAFGQGGRMRTGTEVRNSNLGLPELMV